MELFEVRYTLPGKGNFSERGLTREGVDRLMNLIMRAGGSGAVTPAGNHDTMLKAEMKRVIRCFQGYTPEQRSNMRAFLTLGYKKRHSVGEFYYVHPALPNRAFPRRKAAAKAALAVAA